MGIGSLFASPDDMNTAIPVAKANALEHRLITFAASIVLLSAKMPRTSQGRHICNPMLRSGTVSAANYGEARGAESRADFVHKLKIVLKELNETVIWLEIIVQSSLISAEFLDGIVAENRELCRIMTASIKTARANDRGYPVIGLPVVHFANAPRSFQIRHQTVDSDI